MSPRDDEPHGYLSLVRHNVDFRRLWLGHVVSLIGDWFNFIALISVTARLDGSPFAVALVFVAKAVPSAIVSPLAGLLVDRFDRRRLMIACDVLRAAVVLGLLLVETRGQLALLYGLTTLQMAVTAVFEPAQSAALPNVVHRRDLLVGNTVMTASWSTMLALGAAAGGFVTAWLGTDAVFLIDSASYLVSAWFIFRARIPQQTEQATRRGVHAGVRDIVSGWQRMRQRPEVGHMAMAKAVWVLGGGGLVFLLALIGQTIVPGEPDVGMGLLFAARGVGTGIGPIMARTLFRDHGRWPVVLGAMVAVTGLSYAGVRTMTSLWVIMGFVMLAHVGGGANWVLSTVLLQERTVDAYRGRVFATEWLLLTAADTASILAASAVLQFTALDLGETVLVFGLFQFGCGLLWMRFIRRSGA